jgi:hypothetical protein
VVSEEGVKLNELLKPLSEAIQLMMERPSELMPFVVVDIDADYFVQLCGSSTDPLRFECPPKGEGFVFERGTAYGAEAAADFAIRYIIENGLAEPNEEVFLEENPPKEMAN